MVVRGNDFIVARCGEDLDWLSQKPNENLKLVARFDPVCDGEATVWHRCVMYSDAGLTWEADPRHAVLGSGRAWPSGGASTDEPTKRQAERTTEPWRADPGH